MNINKIYLQVNLLRDLLNNTAVQTESVMEEKKKNKTLIKNTQSQCL